MPTITTTTAAVKSAAVAAPLALSYGHSTLPAVAAPDFFALAYASLRPGEDIHAAIRREWDEADCRRAGLDPSETPTADDSAAWAEQTREVPSASEYAVFAGWDLGTAEFREDDGPDADEMDAAFAEFDSFADSLANRWEEAELAQALGYRVSEASERAFHAA